MIKVYYFLGRLKLYNTLVRFLQLIVRAYIKLNLFYHDCCEHKGDTYSSVRKQ